MLPSGLMRTRLACTQRVPFQSGRAHRPSAVAMPHDIAIDQFRQSRPTPERHPFAGAPPSESLASSLYIHVPFCLHKCGYCDFYSLVDTEDRQSAFVERLGRELAAWAPWAGPIRTIFVGGGTPTLLRPELWVAMLAAVRGSFDLCGRHGEIEFTVECNPETASPELFEVLATGGVNRLSIGAQSFRPHLLHTLERWHHPENVARAISMARAAGIRRCSIDLIFGIPGQTLDLWSQDLKFALDLGLDHISCYALTYEPGTAMSARLARRELTRADEDLEADMYEFTLEACRSAGLDRYEVSNFARQGQECRHNLAYWRQEQWIAAGPSASGHLAGYRWKNLPRLGDYLSRSEAGFPRVVDVEPPDPARALAERLMSAVRLREGVPRQSVMEAAERLGHEVASRIQAVAQRAIEHGDLREVGDYWMPTDRGILLADRIGSEFIRAAR